MDITGGVEILQIVDVVSREKGVAKESIFDALCKAVEAVSKRKYGQELEIIADINRSNGAISLRRERVVVKTIDEEEADKQILLTDAKHIDADIEVGATLVEELPPIEFGRVNSQYFKQVMTFNIRQAERDKEYEDFIGRKGEIITGVIKRLEYGNIIVDFGNTETFLPKEEAIPREIFRPGDRVRAIIKDVRREVKSPQIILSRADGEFLAELFRQEVPEIYDGLVSIKAVVRDAGSRAKLAVYTTDPTVDPVGACIGPRGSRVSAVYNELQGEKIDIIEWSEHLANYAVNALTAKTKEVTVEVTKLVIDEDTNSIEAVVPDDHLSLAIGRRGQNVRLASKLIGWNIDVMSESDESERRTQEFDRVTELFASSLNVDEVIGQLLATEGFNSIEEVAFIELDELAAIEGFDADIAGELQSRAKDFVQAQEKAMNDRWKELGVSEELATLPNMTSQLMVSLGENGITNKDALTSMSQSDLNNILASLDYEQEEIAELVEAAVA